MGTKLSSSNGMPSGRMTGITYALTMHPRRRRRRPTRACWPTDGLRPPAAEAQGVRRAGVVQRRASATHLPMACMALANLLKQVAASLKRRLRRHIAPDLLVPEWNPVFPGAACVGALIDGFAQHCHVVDTDTPTSTPGSQKTALKSSPPSRRRSR